MYLPCNDLRSTAGIQTAGCGCPAGLFQRHYNHTDALLRNTMITVRPLSIMLSSNCHAWSGISTDFGVHLGVLTVCRRAAPYLSMMGQASSTTSSPTNSSRRYSRCRIYPKANAMPQATRLDKYLARSHCYQTIRQIRPVRVWLASGLATTCKPIRESKKSYHPCNNLDICGGHSCDTINEGDP